MTPGRRSLLLGGAALTVASRARAQPRPVMDAAGRSVAVPTAPRRVFPAGPGAAVLVLAVAPYRLAGWPAPPSTEIHAWLPAALVDLPVLGRLTGGAPSADAARVKASGADLVLDMGTVNAGYAALADRVQAASDVPAVLLDGALARTAALFREAGPLLGAVARGEALATAAEQLLADTLARRPGGPGPRLWLGKGDRGLGFLPGGGINAEVPELLGCSLPAPLPGGARPRTLATPEEMAAFDPEVALVPEAALAQTLRADPAWQATAAGRSGRILVMPHGPFGWVEGPPSVQRLLGLRWLLSALHPSALTPAAMRAEAAGLLALLFGIAVDDAAMAQLTGG
jgi:iron complex transport system substrate-binding protein